MNKLITSLLLTLGLLLGATTIAPAAGAAEPTGSCNLFGECQEPCDLFTPCEEPCNLFEGCTGSAQSGEAAELAQRLYNAEQTVQEYRVQVETLQAKVDTLRRVADRRAATIQRLRAKIRAMR